MLAPRAFHAECLDIASIEEALQIAGQNRERGQAAQALDIYRQILEQLPEQPEALLGLVQLAIDAERYNSAERLLQRLHQAHPDSYEQSLVTGNLRLAQRRLDAAEGAFSSALRLRPNDSVALYKLGYVLREQGRLEESEIHYRKSLASSPDLAEAEFQLALLLLSTDRLEAENADRAALLGNSLGLARRQQGRLADAATCFRRSVELRADLVPARFNLARCLEEQGDTASAAEAYRQAATVPGRRWAPLQRLAASRAERIERRADRRTAQRKLRVAILCQPAVRTKFPPLGAPLDSLGILTLELARRLEPSCDLTLYVPGESHAEIRHDGLTYVYVPVDLDQSLAAALDGGSATSAPLAYSTLYYEGYVRWVAEDLRRRECELAHVWTFSQFVPEIKRLCPGVRVVLHLEDESLTGVDPRQIAERIAATDLVLSCSDYIRDRVRRRVPDQSDKFQTLYNGVDLDRFLDTSVPGSSAPQDSSDRQLLFVGAISPEKGCHVLLEAFELVLKRIPNLRLTLAGGIYLMPPEFGVDLGDEPVVSGLKRFHQDQAWRGFLQRYLPVEGGLGGPVSERIQLTGLIPQATLAALYRAANLFVLPSVWNEPFGMPVIEAMAAGTPVIATRGGGFPEIVEHGKNGLLVERGDPRALADAIVRVLEDDVLSGVLAAAGLERVIEHFSFEEMADQLLAHYHSLCRP